MPAKFGSKTFTGFSRPRSWKTRFPFRNQTGYITVTCATALACDNKNINADRQVGSRPIECIAHITRRSRVTCSNSKLLSLCNQTLSRSLCEQVFAVALLYARYRELTSQHTQAVKLVIYYKWLNACVAHHVTADMVTPEDLGLTMDRSNGMHGWICYIVVHELVICNVRANLIYFN